MDLICRTVPYQQEQILVYFLRRSVQVKTVLDGRQSPRQGGERGQQEAPRMVGPR